MQKELYWYMVLRSSKYPRIHSHQLLLPLLLLLLCVKFNESLGYLLCSIAYMWHALKGCRITWNASDTSKISLQHINNIHKRLNISALIRSWIRMLMLERMMIFPWRPEHHLERLFIFLDDVYAHPLSTISGNWIEGNFSQRIEKIDQGEGDSVN